MKTKTMNERSEPARKIPIVRATWARDIQRPTHFAIESNEIVSHDRSHDNGAERDRPERRLQVSSERVPLAPSHCPAPPAPVPCPCQLDVMNGIVSSSCRSDASAKLPSTSRMCFPGMLKRIRPIPQFAKSIQPRDRCNRCLRRNRLKPLYRQCRRISASSSTEEIMSRTGNMRKWLGIAAVALGLATEVHGQGLYLPAGGARTCRWAAHPLLHRSTPLAPCIGTRRPSANSGDPKSKPAERFFSGIPARVDGAGAFWIAKWKHEKRQRHGRHVESRSCLPTRTKSADLRSRPEHDRRRQHQLSRRCQ